MGELICQRLEAGESLHAICRDPEMPYRNTVRRWVEDDRDGFGAQYARARDNQAHAFADQLIDLADSATAETWQQVRLQMDARKWMASKILPKQYGDKVEQTVQGPDGQALMPTLSVTVRRE